MREFCTERVHPERKLFLHQQAADEQGSSQRFGSCKAGSTVFCEHPAMLLGWRPLLFGWRPSLFLATVSQVCWTKAEAM